MTRIVGGTLVIQHEAAQQCDYCGVIAELRPYGRDSAKICHTCGMKPENRAETDRRFGALLDQTETGQ